MKYLPFEKITYKTKLSEEEVFRRLSENIELGKNVDNSFLSYFKHSYDVNNNYYEGDIDNNSFKVKRIIRYRNSSLPIIIGVLSKDYNSTTIFVIMRIHYLVMLFIIFWCSGILFGLFSMSRYLIEKSEFTFAIFAFPVMLLFAYLITLLPFKYESRKSIKDLKTMFDAEIIEE